MVETEGEIEGRVAIPGALGIEEDRPGRADEDVLRADVAMDQRQRGRRGAVGERIEACPKGGMPFAGGAKIGLEPQRLEDVAGWEESRDRRIAGRCGMDRSKLPANLGGKGDIDARREELRFPQTMVGRVEVLHGEKHRRVVRGDDSRCDPWNARTRRLVPEPLVAVPLDRSEPLVLDRKPRHRPLYAERAIPRGDLPDVR